MGEPLAQQTLQTLFVALAEIKGKDCLASCRGFQPCPDMSKWDMHRCSISFHFFSFLFISYLFFSDLLFSDLLLRLAGVLSDMVFSMKHPTFGAKQGMPDSC
jgi:hypothetical protein